MLQFGTFLLGAILAGGLLGGVGAAWIGSVEKATRDSASGGFGVGFMIVFVAGGVLVVSCVAGALCARWVRHPAASTAGYILTFVLLAVAAWASASGRI